MRKKIIAANWKMHTTVEEGIRLIEEILALLTVQQNENRTIVICPPFTHLESIGNILKRSRRENFYLGAQNCYMEEKGAYTGEISAMMLRSLGVRYIIIGHSERRQYFGEDHMMLAKKIDVALKHELLPIYCCGERLPEREIGKQEQVVEQQLREGLFHLDKETFSKVIIAYEPVWAIGTGKNATPEQAQEMHAFIRELVTRQFGKSVSEHLPILYGGSCNAQNAAALFAQPDVDGGLIGGASLNAKDFSAMADVLLVP